MSELKKLGKWVEFQILLTETARANADEKLKHLKELQAILRRAP
jgi:hypothetical protein